MFIITNRLATNKNVSLMWSRSSNQRYLWQISNHIRKLISFIKLKLAKKLTTLTTLTTLII